MELRNVEALTFDVFGTVVNWRDSIAREAEATLAPKGVDIDWHAFADRWRGRYQPAMEQVRSGARPWLKLDDLHRENLVELFGEYAITGLSDAELLKLTYAWRRLDPWPDVVSGLTRLKSRFVLATLSNGNIALMANLARYANLPWHAILGAEVAQSYKPQPQTYLRSAAALNLEPAQCMMVAAHPSDLAAAQACGFHAAYVHRPHEHGKDKQPDVPETGCFDVAAGSFEELADKLGC